MQYQYDPLDLVMEFSGTASRFFFRDVTPETPAEEIRARVEAMSISMARVEAVLSAEGPIGASIAMSIRQLEGSTKASILEDVHKGMQPGGFIWKLYQRV